MRLAFRLLISTAAAFAAAAHAQTPPPIKPGLWQVRMQHEGAGAPAMPDMSAHLKNMPPEQRRQVEAMMKERGVDMGGGPGQMKICLSKESLDQGRWQGEQGEQGNCKTDFTQRSAKSWKWRSVCTEPKAVSEGEATFVDAEHYNVKTSMTMAMQGGASRTMQTTMNSTWLGADCGDVKPVQAPKKKAG
jgi:hypothetical protein